MKNYIPSEQEEQEVLFEWAKLNYGKYPELKLLYHIPNEGKRSPKTGAILKSIGLVSGIPDICLPVPNVKYGALYIEMKRRKFSKVSEQQKAMIAELRRLGNLVVVCYGFDEAKRAVEYYLRIQRNRA